MKQLWLKLFKKSYKIITNLHMKQIADTVNNYLQKSVPVNASWSRHFGLSQDFFQLVKITQSPRAVDQMLFHGRLMDVNKPTVENDLSVCEVHHTEPVQTGWADPSTFKHNWLCLSLYPTPDLVFTFLNVPNS